MRTDIKVSTSDCGYCGKAHEGFRVKIDSSGVHYVICGAGKKAQRVNIKYRNVTSKNTHQPKTWVVVDSQG